MATDKVKAVKSDGKRDITSYTGLVRNPTPAGKNGQWVINTQANTASCVFDLDDIKEVQPQIAGSQKKVTIAHARAAVCSMASGLSVRLPSITLQTVFEEYRRMGREEELAKLPNPSQERRTDFKSEKTLDEFLA